MAINKLIAKMVVVLCILNACSSISVHQDTQSKELLQKYQQALQKSRHPQ